MNVPDPYRAITDLERARAGLESLVYQLNHKKSPDAVEVLNALEAYDVFGAIDRAQDAFMGHGQ